MVQGSRSKKGTKRSERIKKVNVLEGITFLSCMYGHKQIMHGRINQFQWITHLIVREIREKKTEIWYEHKHITSKKAVEETNYARGLLCNWMFPVILLKVMWHKVYIINKFVEDGLTHQFEVIVQHLLKMISCTSHWCHVATIHLDSTKDSTQVNLCLAGAFFQNAFDTSWFESIFNVGYWWDT